jgi:hypothetical protein
MFECRTTSSEQGRQSPSHRRRHHPAERSSRRPPPQPSNRNALSEGRRPMLPRVPGRVQAKKRSRLAELAASKKDPTPDEAITQRNVPGGGRPRSRATGTPCPTAAGCGLFADRLDSEFAGWVGCRRSCIDCRRGDRVSVRPFDAVQIDNQGEDRFGSRTTKLTVSI